MLFYIADTVWHPRLWHPRLWLGRCGLAVVATKQAREHVRHRCDVILNVVSTHTTSKSFPIPPLSNRTIPFIWSRLVLSYINMASSSSAKSTAKANMDFGAGLTTKKPLGQKDDSQASRVLAMGSYFLSGCMA